MAITLEFKMKIEPKLRARKGRNGWYTPTKTVDCENLLKLYARKALPVGFELIKKKSIGVELTFGFKKTKAIPKDRFYPIVRPDLDNYIKLTCDALNGVIWEDDGLICEINARKIYTLEDLVRITINY